MGAINSFGMFFLGAKFDPMMRGAKGGVERGSEVEEAGHGYGVSMPGLRGEKFPVQNFSSSDEAVIEAERRQPTELIPPYKTVEELAVEPKPVVK